MAVFIYNVDDFPSKSRNEDTFLFFTLLKEQPDLKFKAGKVLQVLLLIIKINNRTYIAHKKKKVSFDKVVSSIQG